MGTLYIAEGEQTIDPDGFCLLVARGANNEIPTLVALDGTELQVVPALADATAAQAFMARVAAAIGWFYSEYQFDKKWANPRYVRRVTFWNGYVRTETPQGLALHDIVYIP